MVITIKLKWVLRHVRRVEREKHGLIVLLSLQAGNTLESDEKAGKKVYKALCQRAKRAIRRTVNLADAWDMA